MSLLVGVLVVLAIVAAAAYAVGRAGHRPVDPDAQAPIERGRAPKPNDPTLPGSGPDRRAHGKP